MKFTNFGKKLFAFIAVLTFGLVLVSCGNGGGNQTDPDAELKAQHQANVQAVLDSIFFDETLLSEVKGNMTLVQSNGKYPDVKIEWASSEEDLIAADGSVTRPALDDPRAVDGKVEVTLTVTASQGEAKGNKTFKAYVLGEKKTNVATIKDIKASFYGIMQENGVIFNGNTKDYTINATITGEVLIVLGTKGFFISDGTGLMYVYSSNPTVKVGDVVTVTAGVYAYYGACQFGSSVSYEAAAAQDFADLTFEKTTIDAYTNELDSARDAGGLIVDLNKMAKYSGYGVELYAKVGKGNQGTNDTYYLEDPYTGEKVALYYYTTADYATQFDALVGKYVNIKVFTYDCYSTNSMYRVLYSGQAITEAEAPTLSDAQKVVAALSNCVLADKLTADVTLPVVEGVEWSLKATYGNAVIENGVLKVTRPENGEGNVKVVVVATATFGAESDSKEIEVEIVEKEDSGIKEVKEFDTEKTYKLGLYQGNNAKYVFVTGAMSGYYGAMSENAAEAADVKLIAVEGGYQIQLTVNGVVSYLELTQSGTYTNVGFVEQPSDFVWTYNAEHNTFTHVFGSDTFYIGTYNTYNTLSASKLDKIGTSFPAHLYEVKDSEQGGGDELPPIQAGDVLVSYEIVNKAMAAGLTYISNDPVEHPNPGFYADGGLKMNFVNMGVQTSTFEAQSNVVVTLVVNALNNNTKAASDKDSFTIYGLDANGNVVATAGIANVVKGENTITLTGEGIVAVKVVMTDYPVVSGTTCANVSLGGVKVSKAA